jgi:hypothetical protein
MKKLGWPKEIRKMTRREREITDMEAGVYVGPGPKFYVYEGNRFHEIYGKLVAYQKKDLVAFWEEVRWNH